MREQVCDGTGGGPLSVVKLGPYTFDLAHEPVPMERTAQGSWRCPECGAHRWVLLEDDERDAYGRTPGGGWFHGTANGRCSLPIPYDAPASLVDERLRPLRFTAETTGECGG